MYNLEGYACHDLAIKKNVEMMHALFRAKNETADLRGADLCDANLFDLGQDSRGYRFLLYFEPDAVIRAGCRRFSIDEAIAHWSIAHNNPILTAEILGKLASTQMIIAARKATHA